MSKPEHSKSTSAFHNDCRTTLEHIWASIQELPPDEDAIDDVQLALLIHDLLRAVIVTYRYVLPTQLLAKTVDSTLDCRCVQVRRGPGSENFDARSIAHKIVVPFDNANNNPLGGSTSPYLNNPLRVPEISAKHRGAQKNKEEWDNLCFILDLIEEKQEPSFTELLLRQVLLEIRRIQNEIKISYPIPLRNNISEVVDIMREFLETPSGGSRLQAISYALFVTMKNHYGMFSAVHSAPVTVTDISGGRAADIICDKKDGSVLAVEIKDTLITLESLTDKIHSARIHKVGELMFIIGNPKLVDSEQVRHKAQSEFKSGLNIYFLESINFLTISLGLLGEKGRTMFLENVGVALEELRLGFRDKKEWESLLQRI